jgi:hypothetical protein
MLVNVSILSYKSDYGKYIYLYRVLDDIAFECAEILAYSADENEARMYADERLVYTVKTLRNIKVREYTCDVYYKDGFAVVYIRMDVEKLFRFPFSQVTSIVVERQR